MNLLARRKLTNRVALTLSLSAMAFGLFWLAWILWTLLEHGNSGLSLTLFTEMTPPPGAEVGGLANAIAGSLIMVVLATLLGTPIGILAGVYLAEYGRNHWLGSTTRFINDLLLSAPSIVIGLFVYAVVVAQTGKFSAWSGVLALALIVLPVVVRTTENMLQLIPNTLREAAFALGAPKSVVISKVTLRAARAGVLTGVLLAVARIAGETAPLLFTALSNQFWSLNLNEPMANLPVTIFKFAMSPFTNWQELAWAGVFLITMGVLVLNIIARVFLRAEKVNKESNQNQTRHPPHAIRACPRGGPGLEKRMEITDAQIEFKDFNFYYGKFHALKNINFKMARHKCTAFIGPSGCGKSTLLRTINRMYDLYPEQRADGQLLFDGRNLLGSDIDVSVLRARNGMVFQKPTPFPMSIYDNIAFGVKLHEKLSNSEMDNRVEWALRKAALWDEVKDKLKQSGMSLSGGQQQRLCIARGIAVKPEVILLDEPTSALDPISTARIEELIDELKEEFTIVIVTHNMQQAARISDYTAYMYLGEMVEFGVTDELFVKPKKKETEDYITGRFG